MRFCTVLFLLYFIYSSEAAMSEKQVKAAAKLVRNTCQPKTKTTDEEIDKMHRGDWDIEPATKCYMFCVLSSQKLIAKDNSLDYDNALTSAKQKLPPSLRDGTLIVIEKCKESSKTLNDKCEAAYEISKCFYFADPVIYFFP